MVTLVTTGLYCSSSANTKCDHYWYHNANSMAVPILQSVSKVTSLGTRKKMLKIGHCKESVYLKKTRKNQLLNHNKCLMTSLIRQTRRSPFQQLCEDQPTYGDIDFPNCVLSSLLELCNTLWSILIDSMLEVTPQKKV